MLLPLSWLWTDTRITTRERERERETKRQTGGDKEKETVKQTIGKMPTPQQFANLNSFRKRKQFLGATAVYCNE
jgi:hypothetical protein